MAAAPTDPLAVRQLGQKTFAREPAVVIGCLAALVDARIILVFAFVTSISAEQQGAIIAFTTALVSVVGSLATRAQVSPVATLSQTPPHPPAPTPTPATPTDPVPSTT